MIAYHGTNQTFDAFDASRLGQNTRSATSGLAFFFAATEDTARAYARLAERMLVEDADRHDAAVADLMVKTLDAEDAGDWDLVEILTAQAEELEIAASRGEGSGGRILTVEISMETPLIMDAASISLKEMPEILREARSAGHDAVIFRDLEDLPSGAGSADDHIAVFDASRITILDRFPLEPNEGPSP